LGVKTIAAAAAAVLSLLIAPLDDPSYTPQWTVSPSAPGWNPGPYDTYQQAIQQAQQQENATGQFTWVHDQNGNLP
jgi:hypothetical protein